MGPLYNVQWALCSDHGVSPAAGVPDPPVGGLRAHALLSYELCVQITAYPRQLESLIRLSEAHARMRFSHNVETIDVDEAYRLQRLEVENLRVKLPSMFKGSLVYVPRHLLCARSLARIKPLVRPS
jgi:hypothetical protein